MQDDMLKEICLLPISYRNSGPSWHEAVRLSPYPKNRDNITEAKIASFLKDSPELIDVWLRWSEDKRSDAGSFPRRSNTDYELGHITIVGHPPPSEFFQEPTLPCARLILLELTI